MKTPSRYRFYFTLKLTKALRAELKTDTDMPTIKVRKTRTFGPYASAETAMAVYNACPIVDGAFIKYIDNGDITTPPAESFLFGYKPMRADKLTVTNYMVPEGVDVPMFHAWPACDPVRQGHLGIETHNRIVKELRD